MNYKKINIKDISPSSYNPRKISKEEYIKLTESIKKYGLVDPIIVNLNNNIIIGGHQRYDIIKNEISDLDLYLFEIGNIGWITSNLNFNLENDIKQKSLCIQLNEMNGEWDNEKLEIIFNDLKENKFDINLTGFDELELKAFENKELENDIDDLFDVIDELDEDDDEIYDNLIVSNKEIIYTLIFNDEDDYQVWNTFLKNNNENLNISNYLIKELDKYV